MPQITPLGVQKTKSPPAEADGDLLKLFEVISKR
jgi:hypothetical protein